MLVGMARLHEIIYGVGMLRPAIVLGALALLFYLFDSHAERQLRHLRNPMVWVGLFFTFWVCLGAPFALDPARSYDFLINDFARVLVIALLLALAVRDLSDVRRLMTALVLGALVFGILVALPAGFREVIAGGYDPNDSAMFIVLVFPLAVYLWRRERHPVLKLLFAAAVIVAAVGMVRTGSRGGFLAFAAVVAYMLVFYRGLRPSARILTVGALAGILAIAGTAEYWSHVESIRDQTDYNRTDDFGRFAIWDRARQYMDANASLGVGIWNFTVAEAQHPVIVTRLEEGRYVKFSAAHSIWFEVGAETGYPGLAAYAGLFLLALVQLWRLARVSRPRSPSSDAAGMATALIGSLLAIVVAGTFLSNAYSAMVWFVFGLALALLKVERLAAAGAAEVEPALPATPLPQRRNVAYHPAPRRIPVGTRRR
jgi:putative inorganic carbon (hco3(-)) transporter